MRLHRIKCKKEERRKRIVEAFAYLHEWNDIPVSQLVGGVCDILKIQRTSAAKDLIYRMNMDYGVDDLEKIVPLEQ